MVRQGCEFLRVFMPPSGEKLFNASFNAFSDQASDNSITQKRFELVYDDTLKQVRVPFLPWGTVTVNSCSF